MDMQIEEQHGGMRIVGKIAHRGHAVDVVTGYDARSDGWPVHIYIDGNKVHGYSAVADTRAEALDAGAKEAINQLDSRHNGGFPTLVRS